VRGLGVDLTWSGREQTKTAAAAAVVRSARKRGIDGAGLGRESCRRANVGCLLCRNRVNIH
jgi:hypothetical protein